MSETQQQRNVAPTASTAMLWQWKGTENRSFIQQILAKGLQHARHCCRHCRIGSEQDSQNLCSFRACFLVGGGVEMIDIYWLLCARRCSKCIICVNTLLLISRSSWDIIFVPASQRGTLSTEQSILQPEIAKLQASWDLVPDIPVFWILHWTASCLLLLVREVEHSIKKVPSPKNLSRGQKLASGIWELGTNGEKLKMRRRGKGIRPPTDLHHVWSPIIKGNIPLDLTLPWSVPVNLSMNGTTSLELLLKMGNAVATWYKISYLTFISTL